MGLEFFWRREVVVDVVVETDNIHLIVFIVIEALLKHESRWWSCELPEHFIRNGLLVNRGSPKQARKVSHHQDNLLLEIWRL